VRFNEPYLYYPGVIFTIPVNHGGDRFSQLPDLYVELLDYNKQTNRAVRMTVN